MDRWSWGVIRSGANAGSVGSDASAVCSSAVRRPRSRADSRYAPMVLAAASGSSPAAAWTRLRAKAGGSDSLLGQEAAHFELRVDAFLEPAEHLQNEPLAENDGVVALLGHGQGSLEPYGLGPSQANEGTCRGTDQRALAACGAPPPRDRPEHRLGKGRRPQGVVQQAAPFLARRDSAGLLLDADPGDRGMRPPFEDVRRLGLVRVSERQLVRVRVARGFARSRAARSRDALSGCR